MWYYYYTSTTIKHILTNNFSIYTYFNIKKISIWYEINEHAIWRWYKFA